jgi:hypothetical protein
MTEREWYLWWMAWRLAYYRRGWLGGYGRG